MRGTGGLTGRGEGRCRAEAARRAMGRSPFEMEAIFEDFAAACGDTAGGLDMALWDMAAQAAGKPAREFFGKPTARAQVCRVVEDEAALAPARWPAAARGRCGRSARHRPRLEKLHMEFRASLLDGRTWPATGGCARTRRAGGGGRG